MRAVADKPAVGIGLIGSGFMGRCHANAFAAVGGLFDLPVSPVKAVLADATDEIAEAGARALGFGRATSDWHALIDDPEVELVAITAPNALHEPMALAAIAAGKTVYCEKPLSTTLASAEAMRDAAEAAGVLTQVGFNFLQNPMIRLAKDIVTSGELGVIVSFRGRHAENYMCDPTSPHSFRTDPEGGGALADIGSHLISLSRHLLGSVRHVSGQCQTVHRSRPVRTGANELAPVVVDDITNALLTFESGAHGSIEANWVASGRTMELSFEITGTKGAVAFTQERMNELHVWSSGVAGREGFTRIESGPANPPYAQFCPAPGHQLGYNDLKTIEVAELLRTHAEGGKGYPDFAEACEVQRVVESIQRSAITERKEKVV